MSFQCGAIVCAANVLDPNGKNPKNRFVVLIRDFAAGDETLFGVAITSTFSYPLSEMMVSLPFSQNPKGRCKTGLSRDSVAVCDWIVGFAIDDLLEQTGFTPPMELEEILKRVEERLDFFLQAK